MDVREKVLSVIRREQMLSPDCAVVVGVSGGADSVTLLHVLTKLWRDGLFSRLVAVHVNHNLRGAEALRDQQFVQRLCEQWQVPLVVESYDIAALAAEQGKGYEETGREQRYIAFEKTAANFKNSRIATAHTADDNAETLLLHLCRGCGVHGAAGIPPVRGSIIRPLITCTRAEIEAYCEENTLSFVTDSTNRDTHYTRNRIRCEVLPVLQTINPETVSAFGRFIEQMRQTDVFLEQLACEAVSKAGTGQPDIYCRQTLLSLTEPVRSRALCKILKTAEQRHVSLVSEALERGQGAVVLPTGMRVEVTESAIRFDQKTPYAAFYIPVEYGESYVIGHKRYTLSIVSRQEYEQKLNISSDRFPNAMDCDKIRGDLILRQRNDGDSFHPAGRKCGKTLKKLFNETKAQSRDTIPVLCDAQGIVAVVGFGCDERVRISHDTTRVLMIKKEDVS